MSNDQAVEKIFVVTFTGNKKYPPRRTPSAARTQNKDALRCVNNSDQICNPVRTDRGKWQDMAPMSMKPPRIKPIYLSNPAFKR